MIKSGSHLQPSTAKSFIRHAVLTLRQYLVLRCRHVPDPFAELHCIRYCSTEQNYANVFRKHDEHFLPHNTPLKEKTERVSFKQGSVTEGLISSIR